MSNQIYDCIVIGAGPSGVAAAAKLTEASSGQLRIAVLEARDRVGGRTLTTNIKGAAFDLGGAYIGPTQNRLIRVARELGVRTHRVHVTGKHVMTLNGKTSTYQGEIPWLSPLALLDLNSAIQTFEKLASKVPSDAPWTAPDAQHWDRITVQQWMDKHMLTADAKAIVRVTIETIACCAPSEVSMLFWLHSISNSNGILRLTEIEGGSQERLFIGGSQQISIGLAKKLKEPVKFNHVVRSIDWPDGKDNRSDYVTVHCELSGGKFTSFRGRHVILALAPNLCRTIRFTPSVPARKQQLFQRMPQGYVTKIRLFYDKPYWREKGFSGFLFSDHGPVSAGFDDCQCTPECPCGELNHGKADSKAGGDGKTPVRVEAPRDLSRCRGVFALMGLICGTHALEWCIRTNESGATKTANQRRDAAATQFARAFRDDRLLKPVDYHELDWNREEFSQGGYSSCCDVGAFSEFGSALAQPLVSESADGKPGVPRVLFAGTECATRMSGYIDGALQAGERAAHDVLVQLSQLPDSKIQHPGKFVDEEPAPPASDDRRFPPDSYPPYETGSRSLPFFERMLPGPRTALVGLFTMLAATAAFFLRSRL